MFDATVDVDSVPVTVGVLVAASPTVETVLTGSVIVSAPVTVGPAGPAGPSGDVQIVAVPAAEWPPADPQPDTLYLKIQE